jgi:hypothetical protein
MSLGSMDSLTKMPAWYFRAKIKESAAERTHRPENAREPRRRGARYKRRPPEPTTIIK